MRNSELHQKINATINEISTVLLGKKAQIKLAISCLSANGHLLIEDYPGVGKTTLAEAISKVLGLDYNRIQCTNDMMPSDIIGVSILNQKSSELIFNQGPIFSNLLLADEINRSTPKTQSALLEAMEERQVTTEGKTHTLEAPFFVIATQNPLEQSGTFPLPESQLDRFLMRISLGYPDTKSETDLLNGVGSRTKVEQLKQTLSKQDLMAIQSAIQTVKVNDKIVQYLLQILQSSRNNGHFKTGLSPRAGIALKQAAQAWAFMEARDYVVPQDIIAVVEAVCCHRLVSNDFSFVSGDYLQDNLIKQISID